jgi:hypothetical protein
LVTRRLSVSRSSHSNKFEHYFHTLRKSISWEADWRSAVQETSLPFFGTRSFISVPQDTAALSCSEPNESSANLLPVYWTPILILSFHLRRLWIGFFPSGLSKKIL